MNTNNNNGPYSQQSQLIQAPSRIPEQFQGLGQATAPRNKQMATFPGQDYHYQKGYPVAFVPYNYGDAALPRPAEQRSHAQPEDPISSHQSTRSYRPSPPNITQDNFDMSIIHYESRAAIYESNYPNMMQEQDLQHDPTRQDDMRYPSPPPPSSENHPYNTQNLESPIEDQMNSFQVVLPPPHEPDAPSPGRSKPIPKPDRLVTKGENGRYVCDWLGCTEEVRDFGRKCEWSKHMDKHDRPYKCPADGCEKLPGFTYSGGLLRHEREVHGKHGGPRKQLNCPHPNCKRHTGKGFSRQENLNEHLRRVHTDAGAQEGEATEEEEEAKVGVKRKRAAAPSGRDDVREELKRLRIENEDLKRNLDVQTAQTNKMMQQIAQLQANQQQAQLQASIQRMPPANMLPQ